MENYGFVYLWYDRKHKRFYIGCHWGNENDSYICSSSWMKRAYNIRPQDFRRRILSRVYTNKKDLLEEEHKWLSLIKDGELKSRYYNVHKHHYGHWSSDDFKKKIVVEKIQKKLEKLVDRGSWSRGKRFSTEHRRRLSQSHIGKPSPKKGKTLSEETRKRISESKRGSTPPNKGISPSTETREKISNSLKHYNNKRRQKLGIQAPKVKVKMSWFIVFPDGRNETVNNLNKFCKDNNLNSGSMCGVAQGKFKQHKGFVVKRLECISDSLTH